MNELDDLLRKAIIKDKENHQNARKQHDAVFLCEEALQLLRSSLPHLSDDQINEMIESRRQRLKESCFDLYLELEILALSRLKRVIIQRFPYEFTEKYTSRSKTPG